MIQIVTDTTSSLTFEEYRRFRITAIPLYIRRDEDSKRELFEISYDEFYKAQRAGAHFSTSQPDPHAFLEVFRPMIEAGDEIICVLLSSGISGTINSANLAKQMLETDKISIIDSRESGYGQASQAIKARQMADAGASRTEIVQALAEMRRRSKIYFVVESLRYLYEGGRLNGAQALIGSLIQIKPIIWFDSSGLMVPLEKVRTLKAAKNRTLDRVKEEVDKNGIVQAGLHYGDNLEEATEYARELERITGIPVPLVKLSPVLGTHTGPDILGPCIITER
ncbi:DegV family protein with EDD domain [Hydrogenispora ethanolica]|jgi:DegV family protein with EDD domain|uniref:DegV family protein with EDD domain n=1 Tax=Hydrogenispora ethanolica TaxID=1082276 RepID=A0A4V2QBK7_HYDET|nr:DegV family protein [Hydrogenispora ethanolica]TCL56802.1 DegV family protein with EDD domain [Hydrogenispora ethanolica]